MGKWSHCDILTANKSSLSLGGYFERDWVFCCNTIFQTFVLHLHFFLAYLHIFGKEMKNYTGDQKSKIIFFDHL